MTLNSSSGMSPNSFRPGSNCGEPADSCGGVVQSLLLAVSLVPTLTSAHLESMFHCFNVSLKESLGFSGNSGHH